MKKIFTLIAAIMMTAAAAQAQSFTFLHNEPDNDYTELVNGASYGVGYEADEFGGVTTLEWNAQLSLRFECVVAEFVYEITVEGAYGAFSAKTCPDMGTDCYEIATDKVNKFTFTRRFEEGFVTNLDIEGSSMVAVNSPVTLKVRVYEPEFEDEAVSCTVVFLPKEQAVVGVVGADSASAPAEYYDLNGVRMAAPADGTIVIRRQGSEVSKMLVR